MTLRKGSIHCKSIIGGLLYNTETAKEITGYVNYNGDGFKIFKTKNGNYFIAKMESAIVVDNMLNIISDFAYTNIKPISEHEYKRLLGRYNPDKYIELFGEVEEA